MHWTGWSSLTGAAGRIIGRAIGRMARSMLAAVDMVWPLVLSLVRSDGEVERMMNDKRWKDQDKEKGRKG